MKNISLFLVLIAALIVSTVVTVSAQTGVDLSAYMHQVEQRQAQIDAANKKIKQFQPTDAQIAEYRSRIDSAKAQGLGPSPSGKPAFVMSSYGSTNNNLTVQALNAVDLPEGTVVSAYKIVQGNFMPMSWTYFGGTTYSGWYRYDLENGKKASDMEYSGTIIYEIDAFFPDGTVSYTNYSKPVNKWCSCLNPPNTKLIHSATSYMVMNGPKAFLTGPITQVPIANISVMVKDPDVNYDQRTVPFRIIGNTMIIELSASGYSVLPNSEIMIMVATSDGRADQAITVYSGNSQPVLAKEN